MALRSRPRRRGSMTKRRSRVINDDDGDENYRGGATRSLGWELHSIIWGEIQIMAGWITFPWLGISLRGSRHERYLDKVRRKKIKNDSSKGSRMQQFIPYQ